ncbi:odorant receptor 4 [Helicoverpa armigera]|uniref:Odorant receptor n=1 Tax=Helicoverpa armigera TaxID=29058 RepID=A0A7T3KAE1_HELAM|nr:odorant receptor [Helicoverpa armigera]
MTSILRKYGFKRKSKQRFNEKVYTKKDYDESYAPTKKVLGWVAIRMTHSISENATKWWDRFYWFEMFNLFLTGPSEMVSMVSTAYEAKTFLDSIKVFRMMPCFGCVVLSMFKSINMVIHRPVFENLTNELRAMWPQGEVSEEEHEIISGALKQLNIIVKGYYWCNNALLISFLSPPYFLTLARYFGHDSPMGLHFLYWLPFDPYQPVYYEITLVLQTWHACVVIYFNVAWDMLFCLFLCHITTQFDLLARRVRRLFYVTVDQQLVRSYPMALVSEEMLRVEGERVRSQGDNYWQTRHHAEITQIVLRHHALIRLTGDVERMFSLALLINFMNSSIIICFCGFCCVLIEEWNEVAYKSFLVTALTQTWLLCWYGQKLIDSSKRLADALYDCGWYNASKKARSAVLIMLHRAQKGIYVTTHGFSVISLASYSTIIKTAWSYFTLLLNFFKDKSANL